MKVETTSELVSQTMDELYPCLTSPSSNDMKVNKRKVTLIILFFVVVSILGAILLTMKTFDWHLSFLREEPVLFLVPLLVNFLALFSSMAGLFVTMTRVESWSKLLAKKMGIAQPIPQDIIFFLRSLCLVLCAVPLIIASFSPFSFAQRFFGKYHDEAVAIMYRMEAEQGDAEAAYRIGECYKYGMGVPKNKMEAIRWYRVAAEQGHADALHELVEHTCLDDVEIVKWLRKLGDVDAQAQYRLGKIYECGRGIPKDNIESVRWYHKAAERGHFFAQFHLGLCYKNGIGVVQNKDEAEKWFDRIKDPDFQFYIGCYLFEGKNVKQDKVEAVSWVRKAAEQGRCLAQLALGVCYANGEGIEQNKVEAVKWYRKAAGQGEKMHNLNLAFVMPTVGVSSKIRPKLLNGIARLQKLRNVPLQYYVGVTLSFG